MDNNNISYSNENLPQVSLSKSKNKIILIISGIILVLIIGVSCYLLGKRSELRNTNQYKKPSLTPFIQNTSAIESPMPTIIKSKEYKIMMVKNAEVVVKNLDTNEEINTGIPIRWEDPNATWCNGFNWSSDGTKIIAPRIKKLFDLNEKSFVNILQLTNNISNYAYQWSPNSNGIYYSLNQDIKGTYYFDFDKSTNTKIADDNLVSTNFNHSVSPDGKKIIIERFTGKDEFGNTISKYLIKDPTTNNEVEILRPPDASKVSNLSLYDFVWNPTNNEVAYTYELNNNDNVKQISKTYLTIAVFNYITQKVTRLSSLTNIKSPVFSPNGETILFENDNGPQELWKIDKNGSNPVKLSDKAVDFGMPPSWAPDGKKIVFTKYNEKNNESVFVIDSDGSNKQLIDSNAECAIFSP